VHHVKRNERERIDERVARAGCRERRFIGEDGRIERDDAGDRERNEWNERRAAGRG
jgi:hypothetical protein